MTEDRLPELLNQAVPPLGPALDSADVLERARRRQTRRRRAAVLASTAVVVAASVGVAAGVGHTSATGQLATGPSCSSSPYAGTGQEQSVSYPTGGRTVRITLKVDDHFTAYWHSCQEHGTSTQSGDDALQASDIGVYTSPRPILSGLQGHPGRPEEDGVFTVRYVATHPGTVTLHGVGSLGSDGYIVVTVTGAPTPTTALAPVDAGGPAAGACLTDPADVAVVRLAPDTPQPRCLSVRKGQRLRIVNSTNSVGEQGETITIVLRGFAPQTLQPGEGYTYPEPLSSVLAPGYHRTSGGPHGDVQLLVEQ